jgi:hypothetical protein
MLRCNFTKKIFSSIFIVATFLSFSFPNIVLGQIEAPTLGEINSTPQAQRSPASLTPGSTELRNSGFESNNAVGGSASNPSLQLNSRGDPTENQISGRENLDVIDTFAGAAQGCFVQLTAISLIWLTDNLFKAIAPDFLKELAGKIIEQKTLGEESKLTSVPVYNEATNKRLDEVIKNLEQQNNKESGFNFGEIGSLGEIKYPGWDAIMYCLVNSLIEQILIATTEWVRSGFDGNPIFVDDPEQFFIDLLDYEAGKSLDSLTDANLCAPFQIRVKLGLLRNYTQRDNRKCSLSDIGDNLDLFLDGEFKEDGWRQWFELTQNPSNNPIGSYILVTDDLYAQMSRRGNVVTAELGWNSGFLGHTTEWGETITPGQYFGQLFQKISGQPADRITFADEFDELINALANYLVGELFQEIRGGL